jgi:hypothetical protein
LAEEKPSNGREKKKRMRKGKIKEIKEKGLNRKEGQES